jgi:hypothetical protein
MSKMDKTMPNKPFSSVNEKYPDHVGITAGNMFPGGSADAKGTDRAFRPVRDAGPFNPQNTKAGVSPESSGSVTYGGNVKIDADPS